MKRLIVLFIPMIILGLMTACGNEDTNAENNEVKIVEAEFNPQETAEVGETVTLKNTVTLGGEKVTDAEVKFEYWITGDQDNSVTVEAENNDDGTYTADVTFEEDADYEIYAHTDAADQHTMPKRTIVVGEGGEANAHHQDHNDNNDHDHHNDHNDNNDHDHDHHNDHN
ncbi:hypothetical protein JNUCC1_02981 [Lentibacillus sp. JNUCC-1]|uniref:FixH family protein n=1 Tax=Lentibacillus sp. JNUCC-1 TaxID=2654513 RepID=UPI0012E7E1BD|nr:FixH family protein [Lentibacillus sp. JNUCC-1]MUV39108.1 hypothetical protein [Lentibacillus sp. JNUCC-1]